MSKYKLIELNKAVVIEVNNIKHYDKFLHKIQQIKMKDLWNNKEDEAWKNHNSKN